MRSELAIDTRAAVNDVQAVERRPGRPWAIFFSTSLVLIVCIRFFSENMGLVPGVVQFVDVPLTALLLFMGLLAFLRRGMCADILSLRTILFLFLTVFSVSLLVNAGRVEWLPATLFFFGFAAPIIFAAAIVNARLTRQDIRFVVRTFFWLGILQLGVGVFYGFPLFLATRNPDYVSGTFGRNAYQFTYFLGIWFLYVLGGVAVKAERRLRGTGVAIGLSAIAVYVLFYAAQYRAMLIFFTFVILLTLWASPARISSRLMLTIVIGAISVVALIVVGTAFPNLKLLKVFDLVADTTPLTQSGKVQVAKNVLTMYEDMPQSALVGSGPATFSSRAYVTFADEADPQKDAAGPLAVSLMGGQQYSTDVAAKYVQTIRDKPIQGGTTVSSPKSSYTSLAAEVGILGLLVYLAAYFKALGFSYRRLVASGKDGDGLAVKLAFACFGGLVLLLLQALFDNWLETTRVSIPLWILVGLLAALKSADGTARHSAQTTVESPEPLVTSGRDAP